MSEHDWTPADLYFLYEVARGEAAGALSRWLSAPLASRRDAFAVYRAAADREDAAALAWMRSCEAYDAALTLIAREARQRSDLRSNIAR